jgi:hypothetical protein
VQPHRRVIKFDCIHRYLKGNRKGLLLHTAA